MDRDWIDKHDIVDRYVLKSLTEQEQVEFELYFLQHPEILDEVELVRSMQAGLSEQHELLQPATTQTARPGLLAAISGWFQSPWVVAGNFAAMAALVLLVMLPGEPPRPTAFAGDRVWVGAVRGEQAPLLIEVRSASLVFDIDVAQAGVYQVSLVDAEGVLVSRVSGVEASSDALLVVFDAQLLSAGAYRLQVDSAQGGLVVDRAILLSSAH